MTSAECEIVANAGVQAGFKVGTCYSGNVVHRAGKGQYRLYSDCGRALSRTHTTESIYTAGAYWPLCERCFTAEERHALFLRHMEES